eukprot:TRINITY_DN34213_c0_g1_i1.p1 TRINITY_DN34213_c0_g1~~TRINITY_DN34213_c0_g1_i1.p1  ORF type:complete len:121 (-),score=7.59 TRINITY_DN34213_c0_g1_i1:23-385(-)
MEKWQHLLNPGLRICIAGVILVNFWRHFFDCHKKDESEDDLRSMTKAELVAWLQKNHYSDSAVLKIGQLDGPTLRWLDEEHFGAVLGDEGVKFYAAYHRFDLVTNDDFDGVLTDQRIVFY